MKDVLGLKPPCPGHDSFTGLALTHFLSDAVQLCHDAGSGGAVNCAIHSGSAREPRISCVDDCVGFDEGDVALFKSNLFAGNQFRMAHTEFYRFAGRGSCGTMKNRSKWRSTGSLFG
jgi:hypothetical protein